MGEEPVRAIARGAMGSSYRSWSRRARDVAEREGRLVINISKRQGFKGIRDQMDRGILSYYFGGSPAIGLFRNWAVANWAKKLKVTVESVQESGSKGVLTMFKTKQDREKVLAHVHPRIRGCEVAQLAWVPDMDAAGYTPKMKPTEVKACDLPKWAKADLPKLFLSLGPVLSLPQDTREMVQNKVTATILWDNDKPLPDSVFVRLAGCEFKCPLKRVVADDETHDNDDSDQELEGTNGEHSKANEDGNAGQEEGSGSISGSCNMPQVNSEGCLQKTAHKPHLNHAHESRKGELTLPEIDGNPTQMETGMQKYKRWELDLNAALGDGDNTQASRSSTPDNGGDSSHMFLGLKVLHSWNMECS
ncbi:hypothetical protein R1sor_017313 [Riccia sorocarpa]|uniref:DUF4283 domain-containing protein n=1 Tax=Riccia sorocarpa TaxID=122646 RepID=A0ABD3I6V2_9MARC